MSIVKQFDEFIEQAIKEQRENIEEALTEGAKVLQQALEANSPTDTGEFKNSWRVKLQYSGVRYIGNTRTVKFKKSNEVPLSNILEYAESSKYKGFIQKTFNQNKENIYNVMKEKLNK